MSTIEHILGREILDSRGNPTVEVEVLLDVRRPGPGRGALRRLHRRSSRPSSCATAATATAARASPTPSANVNGEIARGRRRPRRRSTSAASTARCSTLDGTDNKARLGANAILGVSLAVAKAAADELELPLYRYVGGANAHVLPVPMMNVSTAAPTPTTTSTSRSSWSCRSAPPSFSEALRWGTETYHTLKAILHDRGLSTAVGDEGGFAPNLRLQRGGRAAARRGDRAGRLHARATTSPSPSTPPPPSSTRDGAYVLDAARAGRSTAAEMADVHGRPVRPLPDRLDRGRHGRGRLGRLGRAHRACSATRCSSWATTSSSPTSSASAAASTPASPTRSSSRSTRSARSPRPSTPSSLAHRAGYTAVMSHRSGETEDATIADLAVATELRPDQDRRARPQRPGGQVQPAAAHRGRARRDRRVPRPRRPRSPSGGDRVTSDGGR